MRPFRHLLKKPINQLETVEEGGLDEDGQEKNGMNCPVHCGTARVGSVIFKWKDI